MAEIPFQIDFHQVEKRCLYQEITTTALHPIQLNSNTATIARRLKVGYKTVVKAINWVEHSEICCSQYPPSTPHTSHNSYLYDNQNYEKELGYELLRDTTDRIVERTEAYSFQEHERNVSEFKMSKN